MFELGKSYLNPKTSVTNRPNLDQQVFALGLYSVTGSVFGSVKYLTVFCHEDLVG